MQSLLKFMLCPKFIKLVCPTYKLSKFAANTLGKLKLEYKCSVRNLYEFKGSIYRVTLPLGHILLLLGVPSLFTNIPLELVLECIVQRWGKITAFCNLMKKDCIKIIKLIFGTSYCVCNNIFYRRVWGTPMGLPSSAIFL